MDEAYLQEFENSAVRTLERLATMHVGERKKNQTKYSTSTMTYWCGLGRLLLFFLLINFFITYIIIIYKRKRVHEKAILSLFVIT